MSVFVGQVQANPTPESAPGEWIGFGVGIPYSRDYKYPSIIRTPQIQVPI